MADKTKPGDVSQRDWLYAINVIGFILFAGPFIYGALTVLLNVVFHTQFPEASSSNDSYMFGLISFLGLIMLLYVAIHRFRQGLKGKDKEPEE
jgi:hypothetical protein